MTITDPARVTQEPDALTHPLPAPAHSPQRPKTARPKNRERSHDRTPEILAAVAVAIGAYVLVTRCPAAQPGLMRGFVVVLLTILPGLLYMRFLHQRLAPLRDEYLYNIHRLRVDSPQNLPEPPAPSAYHDQWVQAGGDHANDVKTIYMRKFATQYGFSEQDDVLKSAEGLRNLIAVLICTLVLGAGTYTVVWYPPIAVPATPLQAALGFAFLGAYFFILSALSRRYFQNDLRPGAYLMATVRVISVLLLTLAVAGILTEQGLSRGQIEAIAFIIGVFPTVALQLIRQSIGKVTGWVRGGMEPPYPLSDLDGLDIWSQARLLEVGIEDVQHLAKANLVDVSLATRIPMQRIVDWVDQGALVLHTTLPRGLDDGQARTTYRQLRAIGIRTGSELVLFSDDLGLDLRRRRSWPSTTDPAIGALVGLAGADDLAIGGLLTRAAVIASVIRKEPNFQLIRNWQLDTQEPSGSTTPAVPSV